MKCWNFGGLHVAGLISVATLAMSCIPLKAHGQSPAAQPTHQSPNWSSVEQALGRKGTANPGGVIRFSFPRSDLSVNVSGITLKPALALGGWVAFKELASGQAMVMGDLVLTEAEVTPVMAVLQAGGVEQTALHNHLLNDCRT